MKQGTPDFHFDSSRLKELIQEIGLPIRQLPEIFSLSAEDCLAWWAGNVQVEINERHFNRLSKLLHLDENELYLGTYDRTLARKRLFGDKLALPERYMENQNSFLRTSAHIIRYVTLTRGQWFTDQILTELNVSPLIYENISTRINLTYFVDLLEILARKGFSRLELDTLSSVMFLSMQSTPLGQKFGACQTFEEIYKVLAGSFDLFDSNFDYESKFIGKKYVLKTTMPLHSHPEVEKNEAAQRQLMRYRHLLLGWFPYLAGMAPLFPQAELDFSQGQVTARYVFDLSVGETKPLPAIGLLYSV